MKKKYVFHPGSYAVGENEKLYADMAAGGWLLEKRGSYLSRFRRAEPARLRYRIELASPDTLSGETELPEEQLALYEESGWKHVTGNVFIHVFSSPEDSGAPEIHTDPRQQAATLKGLRRRYYFSWLPLAVILPFNFLLRFLIPVRAGNILYGLAGAFKFSWVAYTALILLYVSMVLWALYAALYGSVRLTRLYRRLKRGRPVDHAPMTRARPHRIVSAALFICCAVSAALLIVQLAQHKKYDMPPEADGPYLLLRDLGWEGGRTSVFSDEYSFVETDRSLLAEHWHTYECVAAGKVSTWMYQDVYMLRDDKLAGLMLPYLMMQSPFTRDVSGFTRVDAEGLDAAYEGKMEYIAVKGSTVYHVTYFEPGTGAGQAAQGDVLRALADMDR
jgi:hypothetical protein